MSQSRRYWYLLHMHTVVMCVQWLCVQWLCAYSDNAYSDYAYSDYAYSDSINMHVYLPNGARDLNFGLRTYLHLFLCVSGEGSGEPAHLCSLT